MSHSLFQRFGTNRFQTQYEELQGKYTKLQKQSDDKSKEIKGLNEKITDLTSECEKKTDMMAILNSRIENYLSEIKSLKEKACLEHDAYCLLKEEARSLKTELADAKSERDLLLSKLETQSAQVATFDEKYQQLENTYTDQLAKNTVLERKLSEQQMEASHCKTLLESISEELQLIKRKFDIN